MFLRRRREILRFEIRKFLSQQYQSNFLDFTWLFWNINGVKNYIDQRASYVGSEVLLCRPEGLFVNQ